jgi:hypothetical protein
MRSQHMAGLSPGVSPVAAFRLARQLKKGRLSYAEFGRRISLVLTGDMRISYIGHATRTR